MKALRIADPGAGRTALRREIRRSAESRYDQRLHAVLLVGQGHSCPAVGGWFGINPATVQRWVHRFAARGLEGLREQERAGRPRRLPASAWARLERDLHRSPRDLGYDRDRWDGKLLAQHLRQHYGVQFGPRQCQRLLCRPGAAPR